jgi:chromosome segregation ATPase
MPSENLTRSVLTRDAVSQIVELQRSLAATSEQGRLLKLELLAREHAEKQLNEELDESRRDYEIANSERLNALSDKIALEDDVLKLQTEVERLEGEKSASAKRLHETLFMNQALRANNESLKQGAVVLNMEKDKLLNEKQALIEQLEFARTVIEDLKAENAKRERALADSQRQHDHAEARLQTMKEQFELEVELTARQTQEVARLAALLDEEKVKVGVLEARCNLMSAEKQNTGMRAQDKLRIERLLNQKLDLDNAVEAMKAERAKDQEQIWNLRASLEALDSEMQHSKRVFSAGQQAFLHSERACEQLRHQLQDVEKNYEKATKKYVFVSCVCVSSLSARH